MQVYGFVHAFALPLDLPVHLKNSCLSPLPERDKAFRVVKTPINPSAPIDQMNHLHALW